MACYYPVGTYRKDGTPCMRPCGQCLGCRLDYSKQWAIRCINEAQLHEENSFITLTYNNENLPEDESVEKSELQSFMKRLRHEINPKKVRFFGCGEYGDRLGRPHYHACIFGYDFPDKEIIFVDYKKRTGKNAKFKRGHDHSLYRSPLLEKVWKKGFSTVGEVTIESAGYVARYVQKKITGRKAPEYYQEKSPEFALMSRMPGIGKKWIEKYIRDVYPKDYIVINGKKYRPPKYYDTIYKKMYPKEFEILEERRLERQDKKRDEDPRVDWRERQREIYLEKITKTLNRSLK